MSFSVNHSTMSKNNEKYSGFCAKIYYVEKIPEHDGYCSDPGPDCGREKTDTSKIKVTKELLNKLKFVDAIDDEGKLDISKISNIKEFERYNNQKTYCNGSGYCGYDGYRKITSIKLYKPVII